MQKWQEQDALRRQQQLQQYCHSTVALQEQKPQQQQPPPVVVQSQRGSGNAKAAQAQQPKQQPRSPRPAHRPAYQTEFSAGCVNAGASAPKPAALVLRHTRLASPPVPSVEAARARVQSASLPCVTTAPPNTARLMLQQDVTASSKNSASSTIRGCVVGRAGLAASTNMTTSTAGASALAAVTAASANAEPVYLRQGQLAASKKKSTSTFGASARVAATAACHEHTDQRCVLRPSLSAVLPLTTDVMYTARSSSSAALHGRVEDGHVHGHGRDPPLLANANLSSRQSMSAVVATNGMYTARSSSSIGNVGRVDEWSAETARPELSGVLVDPPTEFVICEVALAQNEVAAQPQWRATLSAPSSISVAELKRRACSALGLPPEYSAHGRGRLLVGGSSVTSADGATLRAAGAASSPLTFIIYVTNAPGVTH
eukprot:NODE_7091_length_1610_cov_4.088334.p1 GENE.NODE_7091_length_1610_cov_4.088334~~NODE_7091_length_1610_cov_4.088334.p1  ORF type:complete len:429 (+),score=76.11 NODE_7091_length_1610_cov_4.088334:303-1589(+)